MSLNILLMVIIVLLVILLFFSLTCLFHEKQKINQMVHILEDIEQGNLGRRILVKKNDLSANLGYKINQIILHYESLLIQSKKTEQANKEVMTSLSHDIKTPITSLIGYLDAILDHIVTGNEKDEYLKKAHIKSYELKEYVETLFEWFKLNSNERKFHFIDTDIIELTRNLLIDWIPLFENTNFDYEINICEEECFIPIDQNAYQRIINNLLQNIIMHSNGNKITVSIENSNDYLFIAISDNGKGIKQDELPFIFDRLYKSDKARSSKGSGLGLSIVKELVKVHHASVHVESIPDQYTKFKICFCKNKTRK